MIKNFKQFNENNEILLAPNGKVSNLDITQWNLVRTAEFCKWFGDWQNDPENSSKIVDENGEPLVVYRSQDENKLQGIERQSKHFGIYFSENRESTKIYGKIIKSYFLNLKNPIILKDDKWNLSVIPEYLFTHLKKNYDGAIWLRKSEMYEIVAFEPNQIKSTSIVTSTFETNIEKIKSTNLTPEQSDLVRTPAFKSWFGDWENDPENSSKIVDENGEPLVVYHGTKKRFNKFNSKYSSQGVFWFSSDKDKILKGESGAVDSKELIPVFISAKKVAGWKEYEPLTLWQIESKGFQAIQLDDDYIVFEPKLIKLANGSNTTFDINDKDIRK